MNSDQFLPWQFLQGIQYPLRYTVIITSSQTFSSPKFKQYNTNDHLVSILKKPQPPQQWLKKFSPTHPCTN